MKLWKVALGVFLCFALFAAVLQPVQVEAADLVTVYLDPAAGDDTADGLTEATAVKTFEAAYKIVKTGTEGKIVFLSTLELTTETRLPSAKSTVPVTLTSKTGAEGISSNNNVRFMCPTTVENMTFTMTETGTSKSNRALCGEGNKLVIGENVTSVDTDGYYFCLHAGARWAKCASTDLTVKSGTWRNVYVSTYGYKSGSTVAGVTGHAKLTMTGGTLTGFIAPSYASSAVTGSVEINLSNMSATSIYCAPVSSGTVTGDVTVTLGEGAKISGSVFTGATGSGSVTGNVNIILDGADTSGYSKIVNGGGADFTGTVGSGNLTMKSGVIGVAPQSFDTVALDVPAGKTLTVNGVTVTAHTAKAEGTVAFTGAATLNAKEITGTLNCEVVGEKVYNQNFVIAPAGSGVSFPAQSGVTETDGKWSCRDLSKFKGLVITHDEGVTVNLYQGFATTTKIEPYYVEGNVKYYPNLEGKYRFIASRTGYIKMSKNIYMSPEEAQTRVDETVSLVKRDKAWDPEFVRRLTDEALAAFPSDRALWPEFSEIFTIPAFQEGRELHKHTTQKEMEDFIAGHDDGEDNMYVYSMGTTTASPAFDIPLVIFTATDLSGATTLEEAAALVQGNGKPTVHWHAQIHGNEHAAGEAALGMIGMLDGSYGDQFLDSMNIYIIPRLNPDGAYQDMRRIPSQNLDPNRDFMNLETYEVQRQHYVYNLFHPEVVIDGHEYNVSLDSVGIAHKDIMICANRAPYATAELKEQSTNIAYALFDNMKANGLSYGWYTDTVSGAGSNVGSTYTMQQGSIYYLLESYGIYAGTFNYERRVMAHVASVDGVLKYIDANAEVVNKTVNDQWDKLIREGKVYGGDEKIVLDASYRDATELYLPGCNWTDLVTGKLTDRTFPADVADIIVREREAPTAYLVPADHEKIDYILWHTALHGISHYQIPAGASVMVQHVGGTTTEAVITEEQKTVFANGAYVFGMDQSAARILSYLMEPDITDNAAYNSTYAMSGVFTLVNDEYPVYRYARDLNSESKIDYELVPEAPEGLEGDAAMGIITGLDASKLYEYREESSDTYTAVPAGSTQIEGLAEGKYYVRLQAANGNEAGADTVIALFSNTIVYLDQANGSDDNDGYSEAAAVKTINKAYAQLASRVADMPEGTAGTVMFLSEYVNTAYSLTFPSHSFPVILTSKTGAEGLHYNVTGTANNRIVTLGGDTTIKNMTLTVTAGGSFNYFCAGGHKLVIEEDVVCAGNKTFMLVGGRYSTKVSDADMTVKGGTWGNVYFASYAAAHNGPVKFTMTGGTVNSLMMPCYNQAITGDISLYFENVALPTVYCGNANKGNITGNVDVTLGKGVTFKSFYAGSRDAGNISGTVTVTVDGADLTGLHLYGKAKNDTATIGKSVLVYKSGTLGTYSDFDEFIDMSVTVIRGDLNNDGAVSDADAMYLLRYTLFGEGRYPLSQSGDMNGDGSVSDADAMYLLRYTLFGETRYPLH